MSSNSLARALMRCKPVTALVDEHGGGKGHLSRSIGLFQLTMLGVGATIGTGIGTGVVRDGRSLMGISHFESGHIVAPRDRVRDPFPGICPFHGDCLEGLACGPAIERRWGKSLDQLGHDETKLIASYIAHLASTLVLLHMPDRLIFGGGVMKAPGLVEAVRRETAAKLNGYISHPRLDEGLQSYIVTPGLGDDAGITGAIELGRQALAKG
ncbi:MAG: hypothetical protein B7Y31_11970 [Novosphingobium sp. 16-62-11]|nr:MAG: hypothetical protein B7Y31_11970 [Novosphingobium sp. 16-62-11]